MDEIFKQRVQLDLTQEMIERVDSLKERTEVSTRAELIRNAIKFYDAHLPRGPRRIVLGKVEQVPPETQDLLAMRLDDVSRLLHREGFSRVETLQVCLSLAKDILDELCHVFEPPINPMAPEMVIAKALSKAMKVYISG